MDLPVAAVSVVWLPFHYSLSVTPFSTIIGIDSFSPSVKRIWYFYKTDNIYKNIDIDVKELYITVPCY